MRYVDTCVDGLGTVSKEVLTINGSAEPEYYDISLRLRFIKPSEAINLTDDINQGFIGSGRHTLNVFRFGSA